MSTPRLGIIVASVRDGRIGDKIGAWIADVARNDDNFGVDLIDLAEVALPITADEPHHPRTGNYTQDRTKRWSERIAACDAFVLVTPEYNHGYPASLKNALDLISSEWAGKPVGFASYGGVSGGLRAVQQLKTVVLALQMVPVVEAFVGTFAMKAIQDGRFVPTAEQEQGTKDMLKALHQRTT